MSTFTGLNTAASALSAARRGIELTGQNIANQTSAGYTRQRLETSAVAAVAQAGRFSAGAVPGQGVSVDGVARLGDALLDSRVRDALGAAGFWSVRAQAARTAEATMAEPTEAGLAHRLSQFWADWQDLSNSPDAAAAAAVVLNDASALASQIAAGYAAASSQWSEARAGVERTVSEVNTAADQIAQLNREIRDALGAGRSANELIDRRAVLAERVSRQTGATASVEQDGTLTVRIDGNALVSGVEARHLVASGPSGITAGQPVTVAWAHRPDQPVALSGGELGGALSVLAPASEGGTLAQLADTYNRLATTLAERVNAQHRAGATAAGEPGGDFFDVSAAGPAALSLRVVPTRADQLALAAPGAGAFDSSNADAISQIGSSAGSPDALWADFVTSFGVATAGDVQRASVAEVAAVTAVGAQQSVAAVDGDEETINLLTYQTAYQAAARVLTAVDEALDVLINRTGLVGR
ncbi:flagellar hook-associated protein FlgK [Microbacterium marinilacus]|uniref:Flagellar hook-associated protein 1 n=1 Tax=Microbacterium marinilacus TaxID=415209 RepID=A0ABP7B4R0_9MICO|nr:flagellar hook-associated protein FlgK [Microbacterium marinilacus]MBY0687743.1 flagellar hook-associated protein FlgK [Microbacterium marinilacus]